MVTEQIKYYNQWLQQKNYKSFYLAFLRFAISLWLLKEVWINWAAMDILYGPSSFVTSKINFLNRLPGGFLFVKNHYHWFFFLYVPLIFLNVFGIGRWVTGALLFFMVYILQKMNGSIINNGDVAMKLILFYLIFADTYQSFVLVKPRHGSYGGRRLRNLLSNLAAFSIMLQLCVAYFTSGLAKISDPFWLHGEAIYYVLHMERFMGTPFNKYIAQNKWIDITGNYAVILFELLFPILIWIKKFRTPLLITGLIFHLCIYIFLMIYGFQIIFVLTYGLFLPNKKLQALAQKIIFLHRKRKAV